MLAVYFVFHQAPQVEKESGAKEGKILEILELSNLCTTMFAFACCLNIYQADKIYLKYVK